MHPVNAAEFAHSRRALSSTITNQFQAKPAAPLIHKFY